MDQEFRNNNNIPDPDSRRPKPATNNHNPLHAAGSNSLATNQPDDHLRRASHKKANELRLDQMDRNIDDLVGQVKLEVAFAAKRD